MSGNAKPEVAPGEVAERPGSGVWRAALLGLAGLLLPAALVVGAEVSNGGRLMSVAAVSAGVLVWTCGVSHYFVMRLWEAIHLRLDAASSKPPTRVAWLPAMLGMLERTAYAFGLWSCIERGDSEWTRFLLTAMGGWVVLKLAGGWQTWGKGSSLAIARFMTGLLLNGVSIVYGLAGGYAAHVVLRVV